MNATAFGDGVKLYSDIKKKGSRFTGDMRAKYGTLDELERIKPAAFIVKVDNQMSTRQKIEVRGDLKLPAYVARHWTENEDVSAGFKANIKQVRQGVIEYAMSVNVPVAVNTEEGLVPLKTSLKGRYINTQFQFESSTVVNYMSSEVFRFSVQSKTVKSDQNTKRMIMSQLLYPQINEDNSFDLVESVAKVKLVHAFTESHMEYDFVASLTSNHQQVVDMGVNNLWISSGLRLENESKSLSFNIAGKTSKAKKAELDISYDSDDQSVSVDVRQTLTPEMPSVLSGSGRYDKKDSKVTVNFNRDKNPITVFLYFPQDKNIYQFDMHNQDSSLINMDVPVRVSASLSVDNLTKLQFNSTWSTNRGIGILVSNLITENDYEQFFEMENNAFQNVPEHVTLTSKVFNNQEWNTSLVVNEIYTLDTTTSFKMENDYKITAEAGFVNNLIAGPYSGIGKVDIDDTDLLIEVEWEGDYKGNSPCTVRVFNDDEGFSAGYSCDEENNNYDIVWQMNDKKFSVSVEQEHIEKLNLDISYKLDERNPSFVANVAALFNFDSESSEAKMISFVDEINPLSWSFRSAIAYQESSLRVKINQLSTEISWNKDEKTLNVNLALPDEMSSDEYGDKFEFSVSDVSMNSFSLRGRSNAQDDDILVLAYRLNDARNDFGFEMKLPLVDQRVLVKFDRHSEEALENDEITVNLVKNDGKQSLISYQLNCDWSDARSIDCSFGYDINLGIKSMMKVGMKMENQSHSAAHKAIINHFIHFELDEKVSVHITNEAGQREEESEEADIVTWYDKLIIDLNNDVKYVEADLIYAESENPSVELSARNNYIGPIKINGGVLNANDFTLAIAMKQESSSDSRSARSASYSSELEPAHYSSEPEKVYDSSESSWETDSSYDDIVYAQKNYKEVSISENLYSLNGDNNVKLIVGAGSLDKDGNEVEAYLRFKLDDDESFQETEFVMQSGEKVLVKMSGVIDLIADFSTEAIKHGNTAVLTVNQEITDTSGPLSNLIKESTDDCLAAENCKVHMRFTAVDHSPYNLVAELDTNIVEEIAYYAEIRAIDDTHFDKDGTSSAESQSFTFEVNDGPNSFDNGESLIRFHVELDNHHESFSISGDFDGSLIVDNKVDFLVLASEKDGQARLNVKLENSGIDVSFPTRADLPFDFKYKMSFETPSFKGLNKINFVGDLRGKLRVQNNGLKMVTTIEEHDFLIEFMFSDAKNSPKLSAKFDSQSNELSETVLSNALSQYSDIIAALPTVDFNFEAEHVPEKSISLDTSLNIDEDEFSVGFKFSELQSRVYTRHAFDVDVPKKMAIGYKYTAATIQEPMGLDIELQIGEDVDTIISTNFGAELRTEGSPSAKVFFTMTNQGFEELPMLPLKVNIENVISLKNAEISTVWWRNLQNFELANKFNMEQVWENDNHTINWQPNIKVVTRNDGLEYEIGITHNCDFFAQTGIPTGSSFVRYQVDVNGDVMDVISQLTTDSSTKFESMLARMALLIGSPVYVPTIPLQKLQKMILTPSSRSKRQASSAIYETEASFIISKADKVQTLRLIESYEQRRSSLKGSMELQNDFEMLAAVTGPQFRFDGEIDNKRKEARVSVLLHGERYLIDSKYDAEFERKDQHLSMELNEVRVEQNIPFLTKIGMPNKIETTANCFIVLSEPMLISCDQLRLVVGSMDKGDTEYSASGSYKVEGENVNANVYFDHNDERLIALGVAKKNHFSAVGKNIECPAEQKCFINTHTQEIIEQSNDQFESLQKVMERESNLKIYQDVSSKDNVYVLDYSATSTEGIEMTAFGTYTGSKKAQSIYFTGDYNQQTVEINMNIATNKLNGQINVSLNDDSSDEAGNIGAEYALDYGYGSVSAHVMGMDSIDNFETGVQYTMAGDYGLGFYYHQNPSDLETNDYLAEGFIDSVLTTSEAYKVFVLRANQKAFILQHATSDSPLNKASIEWSTLPLQINGNIVQNGANYTVHVNPKQILMTHSDKDNKIQQFEFGYKMINNQRPTIIVELFHTCDMIPIEPFSFSIGSGLTDFIITFENETHKNKFEVMFNKVNELSVRVTRDDEQAQLGLVLLTSKLGVQANYENSMLGLDHHATAQLYIDPSLVFDARFNKKSFHFEVIPIMTVHKGYGRFGLRIEQNIFDQPESMEGVLATELGLVSARAGLEISLNGKNRGESMIQVDWQSGLSFMVSDTLFDELELSLTMGVKGHAESTIKIYATLDSPQMNLDHEVSALILVPVFGGSMATGFVLERNFNGEEWRAGLIAGFEHDEKFSLTAVYDNDDRQIFGWRVTDLYQKLNLGVATIERSHEDSQLTVTMLDGSWVEFNGQLKENGLHLEITTSTNYTGPVAPLYVDIAATAYEDEIKFDMKLNQETVQLALTHVDDNLGITFIRVDPGSSFRRSGHFVFVNEDNRFGFEGEINGESAEFTVSWDYKFENAGHLTIMMKNDASAQLPEQATLSSKWNLKSINDNLQITCAFDTPSFHRSLMIKGGVQSPTNFVIQVDHDLEILPVPSFQISLVDEDEQSLILAAGNEKLEVYFAHEDKKISLEMPSLNLPIKELSAYYGEEPAQFDIKINDMELGFVVNELKNDNQANVLDFEAISRIPALTPQRISIKSRFIMSNGHVEGHFERTFDDSRHLVSFDYENDHNELSLSLNHNDTILYALYVPEQLEVVGKAGQQLGNNEMMVLSIKKFVINSVELSGKARFSLVPFAFDFNSEKLKIESEFSLQHWFLRVQSDGTVPGINYKKLAVARNNEEYVYRVTDSEDNIRAMKLILTPGEISFSNKVVALLPEEMSLIYLVENDQFFANSTFKTFTLDFAGHIEAGYNNGGIKVLLSENHAFQSADVETNSLKVILNHSSGSKYQPFTVEMINNGKIMGVQTVMMSKPGALLVGYKLKNIEFLGIAKQFQADYSAVNTDKEQSLTLHVKVDKDKTTIKGYLEHESDLTSQNTRAGLYFQHNDSVFDLLKADLNIVHGDNCVISFNSFVGSLNVVSHQGQTVVTLANDEKQIVYDIVHVVELPMIHMSLSENDSILFELKTQSPGDGLKSINLYLSDVSHIFQTEHNPTFTFMAFKHCARSGIQYSCGDEEKHDFMAAVSLEKTEDFYILYRGYTKYDGVEHDVFRFELLSLATGDQSIDLISENLGVWTEHYLGLDPLAITIHAKWDLTSFIEGKQWNESTDWISFGIDAGFKSTGPYFFAIEWTLIDSFKLALENYDKNYTRQTVFAYQMIYNVDFENQRRNKNQVGVTTTHHIVFPDYTVEFGFDFDVDHTQAEHNGFTTINANFTKDEETLNVLIDVSQDVNSGIYSANVVTKNMAESRTFVELNTQSNQFNADYATPESPGFARVTVNYNPRCVPACINDVFVKIDDATSTLKITNYGYDLKINSDEFEASSSFSINDMMFYASLSSDDYEIDPMESVTDLSMLNEKLVFHMDVGKVSLALDIGLFTDNLIVTDNEFKVIDWSIVTEEMKDDFFMHLSFDVRNVLAVLFYYVCFMQRSVLT